MNFEISQVIGVAYNFPSSLSFRQKETKGLTFTTHSSQTKKFSYFLKSDGPPEKNLMLKRDSETSMILGCWPEPEVAIVLGAKHQIKGWSLGIDLTCYPLELQGRQRLPYGWSDGTDFGKRWPGSCLIGQIFENVDPDDEQIDMQIIRNGQLHYDHSYKTGRSVYSFTDLPKMIVKERVNQMGEHEADLPPSKIISIGEDGYLPKGTIVLCGTALICKDEEKWLLPGDTVTVSSRNLGKLSSKVS